MFPKNRSDVEYPGVAKHSGTRKDGRDLVQEWIDKTKDKVNFSFSFFALFASRLSLLLLLSSPITFTYFQVQSGCGVKHSHHAVHLCFFF